MNRSKFSEGEITYEIPQFLMMGEDARENQYLMVDMALAGLGLRLVTDEAGEPTIVAGAGAVEYTFTLVE